MKTSLIHFMLVLALGTFPCHANQTIKEDKPIRLIAGQRYDFTPVIAAYRAVRPATNVLTGRIFRGGPTSVMMERRMGGTFHLRANSPFEVHQLLKKGVAARSIVTGISFPELLQQPRATWAYFDERPTIVPTAISNYPERFTDGVEVTVFAWPVKTLEMVNGEGRRNLVPHYDHGVPQTGEPANWRVHPNGKLEAVK